MNRTIRKSFYIRDIRDQRGSSSQGRGTPKKCVGTCHPTLPISPGLAYRLA